MTIEAILSQLELTFGRPSATVLFQNNTTFTSQFNQIYTPESLLHCNEECQEVAVLGGVLYSAAQIVGTTMFLFLQSGIFPRRGFETWENVAAKTWPALKLHVQQAYQRKLVDKWRRCLISNVLRHLPSPWGITSESHRFQRTWGIRARGDARRDGVEVTVLPLWLQPQPPPRSRPDGIHGRILWVR
jgi:hypothetical protein